MARKKASKKKVAKKKVAKKTSSSKAVVSWKDRLAAMATQESDRKTVLGGGGDMIKLSKGQFKFQGEELGEELAVVVVDFIKTRSYYDRPYDEDNPTPPACFAISADGKNMEPHETSPDVQADECADCWANEFKSSHNEKGKACRESYFLACIAENQLGEKDPDIAYLKVPPTSLSSWDSYMVKRNEVLHLPALAFITNITFDDEVDYQKIFFEESGRTSEAHYEALFAANEAAHEVMMKAPDVSNYEPPGSGKKKTKKKVSKKKPAKKKSKKKTARKKSRFS